MLKTVSSTACREESEACWEERAEPLGRAQLTGWPLGLLSGPQFT